MGGISVVATTLTGNNDENDEANARLIAAAPDLLAACKLACEVLRAKGEMNIALHCELAIEKAREKDYEI